MLRLSYVARRKRSDGSVDVVGLVGSIGAVGNPSVLVNEYAKAMAPGSDGDAYRSAYSHVLLVIDNAVRQEHEFPDPATLAARAQAQALAAARARLLAAQRSVAVAQGVAAGLTAAQAELAAAQSAFLLVGGGNV